MSYQIAKLLPANCGSFYVNVEKVNKRLTLFRLGCFFVHDVCGLFVSPIYVPPYMCVNLALTLFSLSFVFVRQPEGRLSLRLSLSFITCAIERVQSTHSATLPHFLSWIQRCIQLGRFSESIMDVHRVSDSTALEAIFILLHEKSFRPLLFGSIRLSFFSPYNPIGSRAGSLQLPSGSFW